MKTAINKLFAYALLPMLFLFIVSCSNDAEDTEVPEGTLSQTEVQTLLDTDEITSTVDSALAELFGQDGNSSKSVSNECYSAEYTDTGFTATFNNCVLNGTDNINGTMIVTYGAGENSAEFTAVYEDFYIGDMKINGTRTFTINVSESEVIGTVAYSITSNLTVEFADGSTLSESGTKNFSIVFEEGQDTLWNVSGSWTIQKDGNTYAIEGNISRQLNCAYWSSGNLAINKNGLEVTVDFGDGTCDDSATLTYPDGTTEEITL